MYRNFEHEDLDTSAKLMAYYNRYYIEAISWWNFRVIYVYFHVYKRLHE